MQRIPVQPKQILVIVLIIIAVFLLLDYQSRTNQLFKVQTQRDIIVQEVILLKQTEQALEQQVEYADSQAMVEQFAREDLHAIQPGDVRVVPLPSTEITPTPMPVVEPTPIEINNWEIWKALFFE